MPNHIPNRSLALSQMLYQRLLAAYPRSHREEYGGAMTQLFRDQCRDAWAEARTWGLVALWLRTVPDLAKTSFLERLANFNPRKFMADKLGSFLSPRSSPASAFLMVFIVVFLLVFSTAATNTRGRPESYAGREEPYRMATVNNIPQNSIPPIFLSNAVNQLNLNVAWGRKYYGGQTLKTTETLAVLKRRIGDEEEPEVVPVKPNNESNIFVAAMSGVFAGGVAGSVAAFIVGRGERRKTALNTP